MAFLLLLISMIIDMSVSQDPAMEIEIGRGESCIGRSGSLKQRPDKEIAYDLYKLYDPNGVLVGESGIYSNKSLRMSICGQMTNAATSCDGEQWCFEEVNNTNNECIAGIANWIDDPEAGNVIEYAAMFNSTEVNEASVMGIRVTVIDIGQYHLNCTNDQSIVNYLIHCATDTNWTHLSFRQNRTTCDWNVTLRSQYGCFNIIDYNSGGGSDAITNLSAGSVFLIIFVVLLLTYCILGCAYNSFYHGRVGMDAIPNKDRWSNTIKYSRAGCEVTRDTLCCSASAGSYQEL